MRGAAKIWHVGVLLPLLAVTACGGENSQSVCPYVGTTGSWSVSGTIGLDDQVINVDAENTANTEAFAACGGFLFIDSSGVSERAFEVTCDTVSGRSVLLSVFMMARLGPSVDQPMDSVASLNGRPIRLTVFAVMGNGDLDHECTASYQLLTGELEEVLATGVLEPPEPELPENFERVRRVKMVFEHSPLEDTCARLPAFEAVEFDLELDLLQVGLEHDSRCTDYQ